MKSKAEELPTEIGQLDALELENLQLKVEKALAGYNAAVVAFQGKFGDIGKRFKFDPQKDSINFASRKIERK